MHSYNYDNHFEEKNNFKIDRSLQANHLQQSY